MTPEEAKKALEIPCEVDCPQRGLKNLCHPEMCVRYKAFCTGVWAGRMAALEVYRQSYRRGWMCALNEFIRRYKMGTKAHNYDKAMTLVMKMKRYGFNKDIKEQITQGFEEDRIDRKE